MPNGASHFGMVWGLWQGNCVIWKLKSCRKWGLGSKTLLMLEWVLKIDDLVSSYKSKSRSVYNHFDKLTNMMNHFVKLNVSNKVPVSTVTKPSILSDQLCLQIQWKNEQALKKKQKKPTISCAFMKQVDSNWRILLFLLFLLLIIFLKLEL